MCYKDTAYFRI